MTHMTIKKTMLESISRFKSSKGDLLRAQGMTMAVWAACLCPLLFLLNVSLRPLALLCPLMLIFIALPMRQSTAEAMQLFLSGAPMATVAMLPLNGYWKKVARSLRMTGLMLLWLLPFAIMLGLLLYALTGMDFLTALGYLSSLGGGLRGGSAGKARGWDVMGGFWRVGGNAAGAGRKLDVKAVGTERFQLLN